MTKVHFIHVWNFQKKRRINKCLNQKKNEPIYFRVRCFELHIKKWLGRTVTKLRKSSQAWLQSKKRAVEEVHSPWASFAQWTQLGGSRSLLKKQMFWQSLKQMWGRGYLKKMKKRIFFLWSRRGLSELQLYSSSFGRESKDIQQEKF